MSENGRFCSQPAGLMPFPRAGPTTFRLRPQSGLWPPAPGLPAVLIKRADCQHPLSVRDLHLQLSPKGPLPSKFEKSGFKDLELPITSDPRNISVPATGVHWSFWGLVSALQPWGQLPQQP